jgi:hypothetical protein
MSESRKIAAILVADVVGYSRLAGADEDRTLSRLRGLRSDLIDPAIAAHHGRIVKRTGDGSLIEFRSVVDAVRCAVEVQTGMAERNAGVALERRIGFRVGIHLGDVVEEADGDLMGDGVNIAARLEGICEPGAICLSEDAYRQVKWPPRHTSSGATVRFQRHAINRVFAMGRHIGDACVLIDAKIVGHRAVVDELGRPVGIVGPGIDMHTHEEFLPRRQRSFLVDPHQSAIARDVGREDGHEFSFEWRGFHVTYLPDLCSPLFLGSLQPALSRVAHCVPRSDRTNL